MKITSKTTKFIDMDTLELLKERCSVRAFLDRPIEQEKLDNILEAGRLAPSACNKQPWTFLVIQSEEAKAKIRECYPTPWFQTAPLYIVLIGNHQTCWSRPSGDSVDIDTSIAATQMILQAHAEGLGSTWVCAFDQDKCHQLFNLPKEEEAVTVLAIGYPDLSKHKTPQKLRKELNEIVRYDSL
ncbi:MAG: nitroreductase family protein [Porphyromonadaceae bacterium]|nr:nitroreductase family protein [Porphyromonadaceae bacterium]